MEWEPQSSGGQIRSSIAAICSNISSSLTQASEPAPRSETFRKMTQIQNTIVYEASRMQASREFDGTPGYIKK
jgi:hypothetical protein